jgi:hypothetical protein
MKAKTIPTTWGRHRRERSELAGVLSVSEAGIPPSSEGDKET